MKIGKLLSEEHIMLDLKAGDKIEAITAMVSCLADSKYLVDRDRFTKDVLEREELKSTGIGNCVAIPHARTDAVSDFVIAYARVPEGIEFESIDAKPVKFIFLMGTPYEKKLNDYLMILAELTRALNKNEFQEALFAADTPNDVIKVFQAPKDIPVLAP